MGCVFTEELHSAINCSRIKEEACCFSATCDRTSEKKNYLCNSYVPLLADGSKFPPHVILNHKKVQKEQPHRVPVVRCQRKSWVEELVVGGVEKRASL
jgi:hypothetical protein